MSYLGAGADWRKRNYLIEPDAAVCANTGAVNRVSDAAFDSVWPGGVITFTEYALGTPNPNFTPAQYGAIGLFQPHVATCSYLNGQAQVANQIVGVPTAPISIDLFGPGTFLTTDATRPVGETACMSGTGLFFGAQTLTFTEADFITPKPVVGVSINLGFNNVIGTTRVRAVDADGNILGTWFNLTDGGYENFNLNRDSNTPLIAALLVDSVDPAGFSLDNVRFSNDCL